ncbi:MAG TPA: S1C family serine protease, partial [Ktedonobacteraceae bacterium]|nr:S1C family serine protease [Ktedonobacteraceae bacterium]
MMYIVAIAGVGPAYADGMPGGNVNDQVVRTVDIAKPAIVRIITQLSGQLAVTFSNGQTVNFPQTPQDGVNGYILAFSGSGAFISAHGDVLTADHVINPVQDDKEELDAGLQQEAAPDIAKYINQNLNPAQPVTENQVTQQLASGQLASTPNYTQPVSRVYLNVDFSGPLTVANFRSIPATQYADVDQIKKQSPFTDFDIAIIHVKGMDNMPMLQLGDSSLVQSQDKLTVLGFPGNADISNNATDLLTLSVTPVLVSAKKTAPNGSPLLQVT